MEEIKVIRSLGGGQYTQDSICKVCEYGKDKHAAAGFATFDRNETFKLQINLAAGIKRTTRQKTNHLTNVIPRREKQYCIAQQKLLKRPLGFSTPEFIRGNHLHP